MRVKKHCSKALASFGICCLLLQRAKGLALPLLHHDRVASPGMF